MRGTPISHMIIAGIGSSLRLRIHAKSQLDLRSLEAR